MTGDEQVVALLGDYIAKLRDFGVSAGIWANLFDVPDLAKDFSDLSAAIASHPTLGFQGDWVLLSAIGGSQFDVGTIARHLVTLVLDGKSASKAVHDLVGFCEAKGTDVWEIHCLHGVTVQNPIELTNDLAIVPPEELLQTSQRNQIFGSGDPDNPRCALRYRWHLSAALARRGSDEISKLGLSYNRGQLPVDRAVAAIIACGFKVEVGAKFWQYPTAGFPQLSTAMHLSASRPRLHMDWREIDRERVTRAFNKIARFADWESFRRIALRLGRARVTIDPADAHLDYGIVAESLLTRGDDTQSEVRVRLMTRAAWVLGADPQSRRDISKQMDRLYSLRSSVAHAGQLPSSESKNRKKWSQQDLLDADVLCTRLLSHALDRGSFVPQDAWGSIVFGGDPSSP